MSMFGGHSFQTPLLKSKYDFVTYNCGLHASFVDTYNSEQALDTLTDRTFFQAGPLYIDVGNGLAADLHNALELDLGPYPFYCFVGHRFVTDAGCGSEQAGPDGSGDLVEIAGRLLQQLQQTADLLRVITELRS
jgi:hypothetical protein